VEFSFNGEDKGRRGQRRWMVEESGAAASESFMAMVLFGRVSPSIAGLLNQRHEGGWLVVTVSIYFLFILHLFF
jgi:hypothetical protein